MFATRALIRSVAGVVTCRAVCFCIRAVLSVPNVKTPHAERLLMNLESQEPIIMGYFGSCMGYFRGIVACNCRPLGFLGRLCCGHTKRRCSAGAFASGVESQRGPRGLSRTRPLQNLAGSRRQQDDGRGLPRGQCPIGVNFHGASRIQVLALLQQCRSQGEREGEQLRLDRRNAGPVLTHFSLHACAHSFLTGGRRRWQGLSDASEYEDAGLRSRHR